MLLARVRVLAVQYLGTPARFELTPDGSGGTDLLLIREAVAPEEWIETHAGWLNVPFPLKAWAAHGVDLRNHDPGRTWDHGCADGQRAGGGREATGHRPAAGRQPAGSRRQVWRGG